MIWNSGFQGASCEFETEEMWPLKGRTGSGGAVLFLEFTSCILNMFIFNFVSLVD